MVSYNGAIEVLGDINTCEDIKEAAIISREGVLIRAFPGDADRSYFASMAATVLGAAETALSELKKGKPDRIIIRSAENTVIVMGAGPEMLLTAVVENEAGIAPALLAMERAVEKNRLL